MPAFTAYIAIMGAGQTPTRHPGLLSASPLGAGEVYDSSVAMRFHPALQTGHVVQVAGCDPTLSGMPAPWGALRLNPTDPSVRRLEPGRTFVVSPTKPGAPVYLTATHAMHLLRGDPAALDRLAKPVFLQADDGGRGLAVWLAAVAADVARGRRAVVPRPLPTLAGAIESQANAAQAPVAPGVDLWPSAPADDVGTAGEACAVTRGVCVAISAVPTFLTAEQGSTDAPVFLFSYRVRMRLQSAEQQGVADPITSATLRSRRWQTVDARGAPLDRPVAGPGVVGQHPRLVAGAADWFAYASRTAHPVDRVLGRGGEGQAGGPDRFVGAFEFAATTAAGAAVVFWADVPPLDLVPPRIIH